MRIDIVLGSVVVVVIDIFAVTVVILSIYHNFSHLFSNLRTSFFFPSSVDADIDMVSKIKTNSENDYYVNNRLHDIQSDYINENHNSNNNNNNSKSINNSHNNNSNNNYISQQNHNIYPHNTRIRSTSAIENISRRKLPFIEYISIVANATNALLGVCPCVKFFVIQ